MPKTFTVDSQNGLKVLDQEVLKPLNTTGDENFAQTDYLQVIVNDTALTTNIRMVTLQATNDNASVTSVWMKLQTKGVGGLFIPSVTSPPTWASYMEGAVVYNNTDRKLYLATNAAWVVVGTQT